MTHIEDNRQSEVKGTAQDHLRQRSRTSDRPNGVSSIDRIKNTQKSFDESRSSTVIFGPLNYIHRNILFQADFYIFNESKKKKVISKVYSLIPDAAKRTRS